MLLLNFDKWSYVDFYFKSGKDYKLKKTGHLLPFNSRDYGLANHNLIELQVKSGSSIRCYVRLEASTESIFMPADLGFSMFDKTYYLKQKIKDRFILGLFLGVLFVMVGYNFFIFLSTKDKNYIYYLLFLISTLYITIHNSGYIVELLKSIGAYPSWFNKIDIIISSFSSICFLFLTRSFLKTKINLPFWDKVLTASVITLLLIPLVIIFISNNLAFTIQGATILAIAFLFLFVSGVGYYRKIPSSGYFFFANLFMLIGVIPLMLKELQVLPENSFTINSFNIGSCIQATLFSLAFANRINILKEENEIKQSEIIDQLKENEKMLVAWKEALINTEKLQKESLAFQYESLKNQVNPHFLFNSLNVLIGLLYKSPEEATKFVRELAQVYRYVLKNKNLEVVSLETEVEFIKAFVFLLKIRFGNSLIININLRSSSQASIPPLTLQMLIENAIKHNTFSTEKPLILDLSIEGNYVVVSNNVQLKKTPEEVSGIGLNNLRNRYKYLTDSEVTVVNDERFFGVKVPML